MTNVSKTVHKDLVRDNKTSALINMDDEGYKKVVAERNKTKTQNNLLNEVNRLNKEVTNQKKEIQSLKEEIISLRSDFKELKELVLKAMRK
jgi:peptidoglycan hydrolase CwlO-like protein